MIGYYNMDLPVSNEAEKGLLCAALANNSLVPVIIDRKMDVEIFHGPQNNLIWAAAVGCHNSDAPVNTESLRMMLGQYGVLKSIDDEYLVSLSQAGSHADNFELYMATLTEVARRRKLIEWCDNAKANAKEAISEETYDALAGEFLTLTTGAVTSKSTKSQAEIVSEGVARAKERAAIRKATPDILFGIPTGFYVLDQVTEGLQLGELSIWGGLSGAGKTLLMTNVAENAAGHSTQPTPTLYRSIEMSDEQVAARALSSGASIDVANIRRGTLLDSELVRMQEYADAIANPAIPLYVDFSREVHIDKLKAQAYIAAKFMGVKLFIVDYLQLVSGYDKRNREREVGQVCAGLKDIARSLNIHVMAAAQLNRSTEQNKDGRPNINNLRESGVIGNTADLICLIWRPDYSQAKKEFGGEDTGLNVAEIIVAKSRMGLTGKIIVEYDPKHSKFTNLVNKPIDNVPPPSAWQQSTFDEEEE